MKCSTRLKCTTPILVILFMLFSALPAFAAGDGEFSLKSSTVVDGDSNVPLNVVIQLDFTGNVDDITVLPYNRNCFHLLDSNGQPVEILTIFPDTQMQDNYKEQVFITPHESLVPGSSYTLVIDKTLVTKKEMKLDRQYQIHFSTTADTTYIEPVLPQALDDLKDNYLTYEGALPLPEMVTTAAPEWSESYPGEAPPETAEDATVAETESVSAMSFAKEEAKGSSDEDSSVTSLLRIAGIILCLSLLGFGGYFTLYKNIGKD